MEQFDVAVIGAGHAGIEAAVASAKRGCKTALFTISLDQLGNMPCNPSIGGSAKGHLVREIDALGGVMGEAGDACCIQMRMLNLSKGASVHSPRAQQVRRMYHRYMKKLCENTQNLRVIQTEIADIVMKDGRVCAVKNVFGTEYPCKAAVICVGTFLAGKIYIGKFAYDSGPDATIPARYLSEHLEKANIHLRRFKTGTPCRVHRDSIDYSKLIPQYGDPQPVPFSFFGKSENLRNDAVCYIANTNEETHKIIRDNLGESPLYSGMIHGVGPRYCPSIEDKVIRFSQRERHQIFVEPTGTDTKEMYLGGFSTSLPEFVQDQMLHSVSGFEHIEVMRSAYAIEYDCINPICLDHRLKFRDFDGLYAAGQFNGTSGYEEAAAQGLIAGINASSYVLGSEPLHLTRESSYIGTLIDDLVTKGTDDPYRMMTARSENRLSLRHSNADQRLTPIGYQNGLISEERFRAFSRKYDNIANIVDKIKKYTVHPDDNLNQYLTDIGTSALQQAVKFDQLLRRPQVNLYDVMQYIDLPLVFDKTELDEAYLQIVYENYIFRQNSQNAHLRDLDRVKLSLDIDYHEILGLSSEACEKPSKLRPDTLLQASHISGLSPADINILLTWLKSGGKHETNS